MRVTKGILTILLVLFIGLHAHGGVLDNLKSNPGVDAASFSFLVVDLKSGKALESYNDNLPLIPASIQKALTIASVVKDHGINYRYPTDLYVRGHVKEGTLAGDVEIVGSGDPSLNTTRWPVSADFVEECYNELKNNGIRRIEGKIWINNSLFSGPAVPPSWAQGDLSQSYGAGVYPFNFQNNANGSRSVADPGKVFVDALKRRLAAGGIEVVDTVSHESRRRVHLYTHKSPPLDEIMRSCMMRSDNMFAEALLRKFALGRGKKGSVEAGAEAETALWRNKGFDMKGIRIVDGSGLSRDNRMTARFMASMLRSMSGNPYYVSFFPLAGQEGTLRRFLADTSLDSYVALKTGSMNGIQCYAGYKLDDDYAPTHVIVIMINRMKGQRSAVKRDVERVLLDIFSGEKASEGERN